MSGLSLSISTKGYSRVGRQLEQTAQLARNPSPAAKAAAEWLAGQTMRRFDEQGNPDGPWEALSPLTLFIRRHRANYPRKSGPAPIGSDTGRLKGSFLPFVDEGGRFFGAGTNVDYADVFNSGGFTVANDVAIAPFTRRVRTGGVVGYVRGRQIGTKVSRVRGYVMRLKGGKEIKARPFYPDGLSNLQSWGYLDKIRQIFAIKFKDTMGGTA